MRQKLTTLILLLTCFNGFGQEPKEIENSIREVRTDIINKIKVGNINEIKSSIQISGYSALRVYEEEFFYLITSDFTSLIESIEISNNLLAFKYQYAELIYDEMNLTLLQYLVDNHKFLVNNIKSSTLSEKDKLSIRLFLAYSLYNNNYCDEKYEQEKTSLTAEYKRKYDDYLLSSNDRIFSQVKKTIGNWGTGGYITTGAIIPVGDLSDYISNAIPLTMGLTLNYKKIYLFAGFGFSTLSQIKNDFFYVKTWRKGDYIHYSHGGVTLGYNVINKSKFGITPIIGMGVSGLAPKSSNESEYNYDGIENIVPDNFLFYGFNFDLRWGNYNCKYLTTKNKTPIKEPYYLITRFGIGINHAQYDKTVPELKGSLLFIKVGFAYQYNIKKKKNWQ